MRRQDSNLRPPGYEPDELPTALLRDIQLHLSVLGYYNTFFSLCQALIFCQIIDIFSAKEYNQIIYSFPQSEWLFLKKNGVRSAFLDTVPVMTGYVFLGFGFGILMHQNGFGVLCAAAMSLFIYAGSMQYVAVSLLASGAGLLTAALTTFVVNARHLFYGISMIDSYKGTGRKKPYLIFALTDETYSLVSKNQCPEGISYHQYCFLVSVIDHFYWVAGTVLGALAGTLIPINYEGIDFVLTALFVTIFVEQWLSTKNHRPAIIGVVSTTLCLWLFGQDVFLIPSMILIAVLLTTMQRTGKEQAHA